MKIFVGLALTLLLTGCWKTIPTFPAPPPSALESCGVLEKASEADLESFVKTVVKNYESYYLCKNKTDTWIKWYNDTSKNYKESMK